MNNQYKTFTKDRFIKYLKKNPKTNFEMDTKYDCIGSQFLCYLTQGRDRIFTLSEGPQWFRDFYWKAMYDMNWRQNRTIGGDRLIYLLNNPKYSGRFV